MSCRCSSTRSAPPYWFRYSWISASFIAACRRALVGAAAAEDGGDGAQEDAQVEAKRPVLDVVQVEHYHLVEAQLAAAAHLPEARHAGRCLQPAELPGLVLGHLARQGRAGSDEAHVTAQHVDEL